ncbi:Glycine--tRNA ligase, chloroplastic/mitochondrial 2 [Linum perenne]
MAILTLPLVISVLKPQARFSFLCYVGDLNPNRLRFSRRHFRRTIVSSTSTSAFQQLQSSTKPESKPLKSSILTFQQAIQRLQDYWASVGCAVMQCSNTEVGAGTMNPLTFLRVLGPEPWNVA